MKFSILALGAAVAGICANQCAAQLQIEPSSPARMPGARLVSQNQDFFGSPQPSNSAAAENADYFAEQAADAQGQVEENNPQSFRNERSVLEKQIPVTTNSQPAPLQVLAGTPEVGMVPVYWPQTVGGCPTPNPIAGYMYRNWCTNGLWDSYPCQRALQCEHIQQQIHGINRYTGKCASCVRPHLAAPYASGSCASGSCASGACASGSCASGGCAANQAPAMAQASQLANSNPQVNSSSLVGDLQAGLPQLNLPTVPADYAMQPAQSQPAQLTSAPMTSGVALPQMPAGVPAVPTAPTLQFPPAPQVLPALPLPSAPPVVASRPSTTLR